MTQALVAAPPVSAAAQPAARPRDRLSWSSTRAAVVPLTVWTAVFWWLIVVPRAWGGRGVGAVTAASLVLGMAVAVSQPWRSVPRVATTLVLWVSVAAVLVAAVSPTGWRGASTATSYVCAAWLLLLVAAELSRRPRHLDLLMAGLVAATLLEFAETWTAWWGGQDPSAAMIGTFYWHDPFAVFLLGGALAGAAIWTLGNGSVRALGLGGFIVGSAGIVFSTSRAVFACLVIGTALVAALAAATGRRTGLYRSLGAGAAAAGFTLLLSGPPFFAHWHSPFAGTDARAAANQSLSQNGGYRIDFWREAIGVFRRHPVTGGGYHSLATGSAGHVPAGWPVSPLAHNGYLQALSDGGLLLGLPLLAGVALLSWLVLKSLYRSVRHRHCTPLLVVPSLILGALLVHSMIDFDWSYPANLAVTGILGGAVLAGGADLRRSQAKTDIDQPRSRTRGVLVGVAVLLAAGFVADSARAGDIGQSLPVSHSTHSLGGLR